MSDNRENVSTTATRGNPDLMFTYNELLEELAKELMKPAIPNEAISVRMLMEKTGRIEKICRSLLENKVRQGKMAKIKIGITYWYYPIE